MTHCACHDDLPPDAQGRCQTCLPPKEAARGAGEADPEVAKWRALAERWAIIRTGYDEVEDGRTGSYQRCRECGRITDGDGPARHRKHCEVGAALTASTPSPRPAGCVCPVERVRREVRACPVHGERKP